MGAGRLFDGPGGASEDDAARIALLEAELDASRLQAEARRVENEQLHEENEQLRDELAWHEACASLPSGTDNAAADVSFSGSAVPSPDTLAGMLATLEARQGDLAARAAGEHSGDVGDVRVVGRDLVEIVEASRRLQGLCAAVQAEALAGLNEVQHVPVLPAEVSSRSMRAETLTGAEAGAALMVSRDSAGLRTAEALTLTRVFTRTLRALREGGDHRVACPDSAARERAAQRRAAPPGRDRGPRLRHGAYRPAAAGPDQTGHRPYRPD